MSQNVASPSAPSTPSAASAASAAPVPGSTMRAWTQRRFGGPDVLELREVPVPEPGPGEVLIAVEASSINAADHYMIGGGALVMRPMFGIRRPRATVPGLDVAGTVVATGPEVRRLAIGDRVFGEIGGTWAQFAVGLEEKLAVAPDTADDIGAVGGLPVAGLTALQGLRDHGRVGHGTSVLVYGATGGVGSFAVQIASALGADVTAVCSAANAERVRSLGATEVVPRDDDPGGDVIDRLVASGRRFDVVFDVAGVQSSRRRSRLLTDGGLCLLAGGPSGGPVLGPIRPLAAAIVTGLVLPGRFRPFVASGNADDLATLASIVDEGSLRTVVDETFTFERIPDAYERFLTSSKTGKLVVSGW